MRRTCGGEGGWTAKSLEAGWFRDINDLFLEALRRYLDSHRPELIIRQDVKWGLHGRD